jgi:hypothetical protein
MRVPIENGLGLINQVLDFIKPPAVTGTELSTTKHLRSSMQRTLFEFQLPRSQILILTKYMVQV